MSMITSAELGLMWQWLTVRLSCGMA